MARGFYGRAGVALSGDLAENLDKLASQVRPAAIAAAMAGGEVIRAAAYDNANVSPGVLGHGVNGEHMRDEIKVNIRETDREVNARIEVDMSIIPYAAHQEFGPHGNAYLRRAVDENRDNVHATVKATFSAQMGTNGKVRTAVRFRAVS